jgi:hypothetical protein
LKQRWKLLAVTLAALSAPMAAASAHVSYMLPNFFSLTDGQMVTITSSFAEKMFNPEVVVTSQDWHLLRPDGRRDSFDKITSFNQVTVLESDIAQPGTYRFTTGERLGRLSTIARVKGAWVIVNPEDPNAKVPEGATETSRSQTATVADVYFTKGKPTRTVIDAAPVGRLAITPVTHPSAIFLDEGFDLAVTYGGKPLPNFELILYRQDGAYDEKPFEQFHKTDAAGRLSLKFDRPGVYLIMGRHMGDAPAGAQTPSCSYTTSLTFEVTR